MELRDVRYFIAVAEELSFRRAATRLYMTQPSLSQAIRKRERQVGAILFDRSTRHVELTEAGAAFLVHAHRLTAFADQTVERVRRPPPGGSDVSVDADLLEQTSLAVNMPSETNETARRVIGQLISASWLSGTYGGAASVSSVARSEWSFCTNTPSGVTEHLLLRSRVDSDRRADRAHRRTRAWVCAVRRQVGQRPKSTSRPRLARDMSLASTERS